MLIGLLMKNVLLWKYFCTTKVFWQIFNRFVILESSPQFVTSKWWDPLYEIQTFIFSDPSVKSMTNSFSFFTREWIHEYVRNSVFTDENMDKKKEIMAEKDGEGGWNKKWGEVAPLVTSPPSSSHPAVSQKIWNICWVAIWFNFDTSMTVFTEENRGGKKLRLDRMEGVNWLLRSRRLPRPTPVRLKSTS